MTKDMIFDIIILSIPAMIIALTSMSYHVSLGGAIFTMSAVSILPRLVSNNFNNNFTAMYAILVGTISYITSMVFT